MPSQTFSASGSFTVPANFLFGSLAIYAIGEGGNGGTSLHGSHGGGGGGGGAFAGENGSNVNTGVSAGTVLTITIGTGGTGTNTSVTGAGVTVTAAFGTSAAGQAGVAGGAAGSNLIAFAGGTGGSGITGSASSGGGGGGSAGDTGAGGNGSGATGGAAGTGTVSPGAAGPAGGSSLNAGNNGNAPGSGGSGGGSGGSLNHSGGTGAPGQVIIVWSTYVPLQQGSPRIRYSPVVSAILTPRRRQTADLVTTSVPPIIWDVPRYPQHSPVSTVYRADRRFQAPTGWPIPVQPPYVPNVAEHRYSKPLFPRKSIIVSPWPSRNVPSAESYRARFKPPYPRRGVVSPTGWPIPVQPPFPPGNGERERVFRPPRRRFAGTSDTFSPQIFIQPTFSTWIYKRRWSKPPWPRRGNVAAQALPPPPIIAAYNPTYWRRPQRYQWYRRGNVPPTGWPIPVQPSTVTGPYGVRRYSKPLLPRKGVLPPYALPPVVPVPAWYRARFKPPYPRKGNPQPNSGLPIKVQPPEVSKSVRRGTKPLFPLRGKLAASSGPYFIPVQPPERMQFVRRWVKPLLPRRGRTNIATFPGVQVVTGYQQIPVQPFTYIPGSAGTDLTTLNLTLFPLNKQGFSFWNRYGDVIFIAYNATSLAVSIQPIVIRTVELQEVQLPTYALQPGAMQAFGPYPVNDFTNPNLANPPISYFMNINVEASGSGVYGGAFRMVSASPVGHTGRYDLLGARLRKAIRNFDVQISSTPGEIHPGEGTPGG